MTSGSKIPVSNAPARVLAEAAGTNAAVPATRQNSTSSRGLLRAVMGFSSAMAKRLLRKQRRHARVAPAGASSAVPPVAQRPGEGAEQAGEDDAEGDEGRQPSLRARDRERQHHEEVCGEHH